MGRQCQRQFLPWATANVNHLKHTSSPTFPAFKPLALREVDLPTFHFMLQTLCLDLSLSIRMSHLLTPVYFHGTLGLISKDLCKCFGLDSWTTDLSIVIYLLIYL